MKRFYSVFLSVVYVLWAVGAQASTLGTPTPAQRYAAVQKELAKGWNTWDTRSVLTHVCLPYAFAIDLNFQSASGARLNRARIGERGADAPLITPGAHSFDGTYTCLSLKWKGVDVMIESAANDTTEVIIVTPLATGDTAASLVVVPKTLWMRGNNVAVDSCSFTIGPKDRSLVLHGEVTGDFRECCRNEIVMGLARPVTICCGTDMSAAEAREFVNRAAEEFETSNRKRWGDAYDCYNAMQSVLGWDSVYDPGIRRVITLVSRIWSSEWFASSDFGGFTLFCWDTYFAAMMLSAGCRDLAYANAVEITEAITEAGFVPNCYYSNGFKSRDRSQPPVGSMAVWTLYRQHGDRWLLELLYDKLLRWNDWWLANREDCGLFCTGSSPYDKVTYFRSEYDANTRYGAILESGLDNSPMYDAATFNADKHLLEQNDAGISSLVVMDCEYLARIADELGKKKDARMLRKRAAHYRGNLCALWDEADGMYYNRSTRDMTLNKRMSPTLFYPLLAQAPDSTQARRMIEEHLTNPDEFWGEWVIPSSPRNDPSFRDNEYWRGRIWAPLNFLVYMGVRNYDFPEVRKELADKSESLLLKSWLSDGYVFENYNAVDGRGDDVVRSDKFYHWGALLGYISLIEKNMIEM